MNHLNKMTRDTSDSSDSENLISFQKSVLAQKKPNNTDNKIDSSSDADDEVENESSEQNEETSDDSSSTTTDDEEEEESSNLLQNKTKIESLRSQLSTLSKVNKNENICDKKDLSNNIQNTTLEKTEKESDKKNEEILVVEDLNGKPGPVVQNDEMEETKDLPKPVIDNERIEIRSELSKMSMEEILRLKEELGSKLYNRAVGIGSCKKPHSKFTSKDELKRDNKNRPREESSKKPVKRFRDVVGLTSELKKEKRDPRFDNMCGEFDEKIHRDAYKFVDGIKAKELETLKVQLNSEDDPDKIAQIKYLIQRIENQNREKKKVEKEKNVFVERKKKNRELVKEGKMPEFVSRQEEKSRGLIEKMPEFVSRQEEKSR